MEHHSRTLRQARKAERATTVRAGMRAEHAAQIILRGHAAEFGFQLSRLMTLNAPEAVHQSRVVLRRLFAALQAFAPLIATDLRRDLTHDLRDLFHAIGQVRDAEVLADQRVGEKQRRHLMAQAAKRRLGLCKSLKSHHMERLAPAMDATFARKSWRSRTVGARPLRKGPVEDLASLALDRAWARAVAVESDLSVCSPKLRHELRKKLKGFRYMAEDFASLWPLERSRPFLAQLRDLQEDLGLLNDMALARSHGLTPDPAEAADAMARVGPAWGSLLAALPWWLTPPLSEPTTVPTTVPTNGPTTVPTSEPTTAPIKVP